MKIIITEGQFKKLNQECDTRIVFEYRTAVRNNHGKKSVCIDEVFYNLILEHELHKFEPKYLMSEALERMIYKFCWEHYTMDSKFVTINFVNGGNPPSIGVIYNPIYK